MSKPSKGLLRWSEQSTRFLTQVLSPALLLCIVGTPLPAQQSVPSTPEPTSQLISRAPDSTIVIGPGDLVDVQVFNTPELTAKHQVSQDGMIQLPGTGNIKVSGLSPLQAEVEIAHRLRDSQQMLDPQVTVLLEQQATREVSVLGEVNRPGIYQLHGAASLDSALAAAGGVTPKEGSTITITHTSDPSHPVHVRVDAKNPTGDHPFFALQPDDVISVSQAGVIYVVGDVQHPGEFSIGNGRPLRALEALALAEGLKDYAAPTKASIIRNTATGAETIPVNLNRVQKNQASDPVLEPSDILVVPHSGGKEFTMSLLPSLTSSAANAVAIALVAH